MYNLSSESIQYSQLLFTHGFLGRVCNILTIGGKKIKTGLQVEGQEVVLCLEVTPVLRYLYLLGMFCF